MRATARLTAALLLAVFALPAEGGSRQECRRACGSAVRSCMTASGRSLRACREAVVRRCAREGLQACSSSLLPPDAGTADVAATRSRTETVRMLADFLRSVPPGAVASALWFLSGRSGRERLDIGPAAVERAWSAAAPAAEATLGLEDVVGALAGLPDLAGEGSAAERARRLGELFGRATAAERSFLARWLVGELRQGALEGVLTEAVAMAAGVEAAAVRDALMVEGDLAVVGEQALRDGGAGLAGRAIQLFRPVLPMLAGTASSPAEALERFGEVAVEAKLGGVRIQVHKSGERIEVYSRKRKPLTDALPEVVESVGRLAADEAIHDGEAIALRADGRP